MQDICQPLLLRYVQYFSLLAPAVHHNSLFASAAYLELIKHRYSLLDTRFTDTHNLLSYNDFTTFSPYIFFCHIISQIRSTWHESKAAWIGLFCTAMAFHTSPLSFITLGASKSEAVWWKFFNEQRCLRGKDRWVDWVDV